MRTNIDVDEELLEQAISVSLLHRDHEYEKIAKIFPLENEFFVD